VRSCRTWATPCLPPPAAPAPAPSSAPPCVPSWASRTPGRPPSTSCWPRWGWGWALGRGRGRGRAGAAAGGPVEGRRPGYSCWSSSYGWVALRCSVLHLLHPLRAGTSTPSPPHPAPPLTSSPQRATQRTPCWRAAACINSTTMSRLSLHPPTTAPTQRPPPQIARPKDFPKFAKFVEWRDASSKVLLTSLTLAAQLGWAPPEGVPLPALPVLARVKAAMRRMDVRSADDYDEQDYGEAGRLLAGHAQVRCCCCCCCWRGWVGGGGGRGGGWLAACRWRGCGARRGRGMWGGGSWGGRGGAAPPALLPCHAPPPLMPPTQAVAANCLTGWSFPWGVRTRLAERLLMAMFDSLDEAQYVEEWVPGWPPAQPAFAAGAWRPGGPGRLLLEQGCSQRQRLVTSACHPCIPTGLPSAVRCGRPPVGGAAACGGPGRVQPAQGVQQ
jgi:hypothetical protein